MTAAAQKAAKKLVAEFMKKFGEDFTIEVRVIPKNPVATEPPETKEDTQEGEFCPVCKGDRNPPCRHHTSEELAAAKE